MNFRDRNFECPNCKEDIDRSMVREICFICNYDIEPDSIWNMYI